MAPEPQLAEAFIGELRGLMVQHNVYRGKVISLSAVPGPMGTRTEVSFHRRRQRVARDRIVLADGLLERVERSTIEFNRHADALRAAGRHLRRGLLLHGPPGTGKTLTATYLADALEDHTVMVLTGPALGLIRATCTMARELQPSRSSRRPGSPASRPPEPPTRPGASPPRGRTRANPHKRSSLPPALRDEGGIGRGHGDKRARGHRLRQ